MKALVLVMILLLCLGSQARAEGMTFQIVPPEVPVSIFGTASKVYADGNIDASAPYRLEALIKEKHILEYSDVILNSPGGDLAGEEKPLPKREDCPEPQRREH